MSRTSMVIALGFFAAVISQVANASDTLTQYAQKCDAAIGETVPDFDCDAGQAVPEGRDNRKPFGFTRFCDWPNVLNHQCDPGSRFQVLKDNDKATIVAHCRTKRTPNDGMYGDIAVIQYSKVNGATCFYQQLEDSGTRLPAKVEAPSKGNPPWFSPARTAGIRCGECHDNGPFIRSPYLAHLADIPGAKFTLPGSHSMSFNDTGEPYAFVGDDFKTWKAYKIEIQGNWCTDCHRMGVSNLTGHANTGAVSGVTPVAETTDPCKVLSSEGGSGTSRVFGVVATLPEQCMKLHNLHTWMIPFDYNERTPNASKAHRFSAANLKAANQFRECAFNWALGQSLPAGCTVTLFAKAYP
jgi:hypothetical protein